MEPHPPPHKPDETSRLDSLAQPEPSRTALDPIAVPDSLHGAQQAVHQLRADRPELLDVSVESRRRALLIVHAVAEECGRRGYVFGLRDDGKPTFQIGIGSDVLVFSLSEEYERREMADPDELSQAQYGWQRVRSKVRDVRSGRLVLRLGDGYSSKFWADRKRWSLIDKLPAALQHAEQVAAAAVERRAREDALRHERRQEWEEAIRQAKQAYVADMNRQRLGRQVADAAKADDIRGYADRLEQFADQTDDCDTTLRAQEWAAWARAEADRLDPFTRHETLTHVEPNEIGPSDLGQYMPKGMSPWSAPG